MKRIFSSGALIALAAAATVGAAFSGTKARAKSYPTKPVTLIVPYKAGGHGPKTGAGGESSILMDATLKHPTSPLALTESDNRCTRKTWVSAERSSGLSSVNKGTREREVDSTRCR